MTQPIRIGLLASTVAMLPALPVTVMAQTTAPSDQIAEIVVTASRRAENVRDVPISIAVVTEEDIKNRGLFNGSDYLRGMAGVNQLEGGPFSQAIVIRGIETSPSGQNFNSGTTTATYFGETPTSNSAGMAGNSNVDIKLVDVERVEVLRGPQGTAFGSSSLGGAVRIIPVAPKLDRFEARASAGYSVTSDSGGDNYNFQLIGNIPIAPDTFAIRAAAYKYEDSGFYSNRAGTDPNFQASMVSAFGVPGSLAIDQEEVGAYSVVGGRLSALLQASDALRLSFNYLKQRSETDGIAMANSGIYEQTLLQIAPEQVRRGQTGGFYDTDLDLANATLDYDFGWANLITTYSHIKSETTSASTFGFAGINVPGSIDAGSDHSEDIAEIRLATKLDGRLNLIAGLYYEDIDDGPKDQFFQTFYWVGDPAANIFAPNGPRLMGAIFDERDSEQKAAYGEVSWKILPQLTLTGGARAYRYDRTRHSSTTGPFTGDSDSTVEAGASGTNYRANLSYKPNNDALIYAGFSQGFRLGRPQVPMGPVCDRDGNGVVDGTGVTIDATGTLNSDSIDNYELGGKFSLLDRRINIEGAIFRMEWTDFPGSFTAPAPPTGCGFTTSINAGKALSEGVEFQATVRVTEQFRLDFGGSWNDARLAENVPAAGLKKDNRLAGAPEYNGNVGAQYEFDIGEYAIALRADAIYVGPFYGNLRESPLTKAGDYIKIDPSLRVTFNNFDVNLYVHNLTNEDAFIYHTATPSTSPLKGHRLRPRTSGINVSYSF